MNKSISILLTILVVVTLACNNESTQVNYKKVNYKAPDKFIDTKILDNYDKAIKVNPNNAEVYAARGSAKYVLKDYKGSIEDFNKALQIKSDLPVAYFSRGLSKKELGDNAGALEDFKKTKELSIKAKDNSLNQLIDEEIKTLSEKRQNN